MIKTSVWISLLINLGVIEINLWENISKILIFPISFVFPHKSLYSKIYFPNSFFDKSPIHVKTPSSKVFEQLKISFCNIPSTNVLILKVNLELKSWIKDK